MYAQRTATYTLNKKYFITRIARSFLLLFYCWQSRLKMLKQAAPLGICCCWIRRNRCVVSFHKQQQTSTPSRWHTYMCHIWRTKNLQHFNCNQIQHNNYKKKKKFALFKDENCQVIFFKETMPTEECTTCEIHSLPGKHSKDYFCRNCQFSYPRQKVNSRLKIDLMNFLKVTHTQAPNRHTHPPQ